MEKLGKELEFISRIKRNGSGTKRVKKPLIELMQGDTFKINCLSMTEKTFIASGFNSFVVRIIQDKTKVL